MSVISFCVFSSQYLWALMKPVLSLKLNEGLMLMTSRNMKLALMGMVWVMPFFQSRRKSECSSLSSLVLMELLKSAR